MKRACIAIVDGNTARLYTYEQLDDDPPRLFEEKNLANVPRRTRDDDLFAELVDKRSPHDAEFASYVMDEIRGLVKVHALGHVILVASPLMLGHLRPFEEKLSRLGVVVDEIQRDLTRLSSSQIHDHLAGLNVIEPRDRVSFARR